MRSSGEHILLLNEMNKWSNELTQCNIQSIYHISEIKTVYFHWRAYSVTLTLSASLHYVYIVQMMSHQNICTDVQHISTKGGQVCDKMWSYKKEHNKLFTCPLQPHEIHKGQCNQCQPKPSPGIFRAIGS
jgi:hypothetical protein